VLASQSGTGIDAINRIASQIIDLWRGILASDGETPNQGCANCQWSEYTQIEPGQIGRSPHPLYCTWTKNFWPSPLPWEPRIFMRPDDGFMCSTWKRRGTDV